MQQISAEMSSEYDRIQMRATEDPGTAGDQGEENWAELLRGWLPRTYEVVTKGRIISQDGTTSPQIDVLVLDENYPKKLLNKKLYLAAGVMAAFECKTTLKSSHIIKAAENCTKLKKMYPFRFGTPYKELHSPLIYGLLAHSHSWKGADSTPHTNIANSLKEADNRHASHPRLQLDLLCVSDLAAWTSFKMTFIGPGQLPDWAKFAPKYGPTGSATSSHIGHSNPDGSSNIFTPIGALIASLSQKMAWERPTLRGLADYYRVAGISGPGSGEARKWPSAIYSGDIRARIEAGQLSNGKLWDEWSVHF